VENSRPLSWIEGRCGICAEGSKFQSPRRKHKKRGHRSFPRPWGGGGVSFDLRWKKIARFDFRLWGSDWGKKKRKKIPLLAIYFFEWAGGKKGGGEKSHFSLKLRGVCILSLEPLTQLIMKKKRGEMKKAPSGKKTPQNRGKVRLDDSPMRENIAV